MHWVVLVEPEGSGNIGAIARVMKNFGFHNLALVNPKCEIGLETRKYAMHAWDIVQKAEVLDRYDEIFDLDADLFVGTTAKVFKETNTSRASMTPRELAKQLENTSAKLALVFGRESSGLTNQELRKCDIVLNIPTSEEYKAMNLSHAVAVILYELYLARASKKRKVNRKEMEKLMNIFEELAKNKRLGLRNPENAIKMFRNVMSRAIVSGSEAKGIIMVLRRALEELEKCKK